ncbi:MAG: alkaline phosphatase family protein [Deltaproteobacteria bacterium]|nr:alkaline phosphatase family protein [Deltaproteobacteria bacterium]
MANKPKKVCVIGLDCALPNSILKYVEQGALPNLEGLIKKGVMAKNGLVPYPTITPPNWTTIATGSWPGTHGITDFHVHEPGTSIHMSSTHQGFNRSDCKVENIWEAAEKAGYKSIVLNYPSSYGTKLKHGIVVGGNSNIINDWRPAECIATEGKFSVCADQVYSTILYPLGGVKVEFDYAEDWENAPESKGEEDQEVEATLPFSDSLYEMAPTTWHFLVQDTSGEGYDRFTLSPTKDFKDAFCTLAPGQWSQKIITTVKTKEGQDKEVSFHVKLLDLSNDLGSFRVYMTGLGEHQGWSDPPEVAKEICDHSPESDFSLRGGGLTAYRKGWIDLDTYVEAQAMQDLFLADAAVYLLSNKEWDIFYMHAHATDWQYHGFMREMDPLTESDPEKNRLAQEAEKKIYMSVDRMIGRIMEAAGKDTLFIIVSDHGAVSDGYSMPLLEPLVEKNLIKVTGDKGIRAYGFGALYSAEIDWSETKAMPQRAVHIYVNVKGRDPDGIVEPGEEYEQVRQDIIDTLLTYVDPETGKRPFAMALRREDARPFGLYGDRVGDVIYAIYPWFGGQHGNILPTAEWGLGTLKAVIIMNGPGIKKGAMLERTIWITDLVPTICYLMDLPVPEYTEGAVIYQAFTDPNFKLKA